MLEIFISGFPFKYKGESKTRGLRDGSVVKNTSFFKIMYIICIFAYMHTGAVADRKGCQIQKLEFQVTLN